MKNKLNDTLESFDSLTIEEQEIVIDIERKRLTDKKREMLVKEVREAEAEYKAGELKPESLEEIMKAIDDSSIEKK